MTFVMYRDVQGFWRWHLRAANGRKLADSGEGYCNRMDCRHAIDLVMGTRSAPVVER
jgi:uncharacterized protein YegP (UPF0339 family)